MKKAISIGIQGFSDLNNLRVVTTTSNLHADCFGFTEEEVFAALDEYGMEDKKDEVKQWYDGFTFGEHRDIYNPWSITNYLDEHRLYPYWASTSSNGLVSRLIRTASADVKEKMEDLLKGKTITVNFYDVMLTPVTEVDDAIVIEFKVHEPDEEETLKDTVRTALDQITEKNYDAELLAQGISADRIRHYGFAFEGKKVLIGQDEKV